MRGTSTTQPHDRWKAPHSLEALGVETTVRPLTVDNTALNTMQLLFTFLCAADAELEAARGSAALGRRTNSGTTPGSSLRSGKSTALLLPDQCQW